MKRNGMLEGPIESNLKGAAVILPHQLLRHESPKDISRKRERVAPASKGEENISNRLKHDLLRPGWMQIRQAISSRSWMTAMTKKKASRKSRSNRSILMTERCSRFNKTRPEQRNLKPNLAIIKFMDQEQRTLPLDRASDARHPALALDAQMDRPPDRGWRYIGRS